MTYVGSTWQMFHDDQLIADLVVTDADFPWLHAEVRPHAKFDTLRYLFGEELRLLEDVDDHVEQWEAAYEKVRRAVSMRYPDGKVVPEFLLHVDGNMAWWRWSDEPFTEDETS